MITIGTRKFRSISDFKKKEQKAMQRKDKTIEDMEILRAGLANAYKKAGIKPNSTMKLLASLRLCSNELLDNFSRLGIEDLPDNMQSEWKKTFQELDSNGNASKILVLGFRPIKLQITNFGPICVFEVNEDRFFAFHREDGKDIKNEDILTICIIFFKEEMELYIQDKDMWDVHIWTAPYLFLQKVITEYFDSDEVSTKVMNGYIYSTANL